MVGCEETGLRMPREREKKGWFSFLRGGGDGGGGRVGECGLTEVDASEAFRWGQEKGAGWCF